MNIVVLSGNLTRNAETRETSSGYQITKFTLAVNDKQKQNGEWVNVASFFDVTVFGAYGAAIAESLTKGVKATVAGKIRQGSYEKDGVKRTTFEVIADTVEVPKQQQRKEPDLYDNDMPF